jgi:hypothetical protein
MEEYQAVRIHDLAGCDEGSIKFFAADDWKAIEVARSLLDHCDVQLWQHYRFIIRLKPNDDTSNLRQEFAAHGLASTQAFRITPKR